MGTTRRCCRRGSHPQQPRRMSTTEADMAIDEPQPNLLSSPLCFSGMNGDRTLGTTGLEG